MTFFTTGDNNFGTSKWIVNAQAGQGTHTTIQSAINSASAGDNVFITPGTYTEDLTLKAGVNIVAFRGSGKTPSVTIIGNATHNTAGIVTLSGMRLQTNSNFLLTVSGSAASTLNLTDIDLNILNNTGISFTTSNAAAVVNLDIITGNIATTGITKFAMTSTGTLNINRTNITNTGASVTASTASAGQLNLLYSTIRHPITTSGTNASTINFSSIDSSAQNVTALTIGGSGTNNAYTDNFLSGTASAISIATTFGLYNSVVSSSNTNAITGAGTLNYSGVIFSSTSSTINTTTQVPTAQSVAQGGTGLTTIGNSKILATNASGVLAARVFTLNRQVFAATGTYTPTTGMLYCDVEVVGGGGGGAGSDVTGTTTVAVGGGGGGGGYARGKFSAATIGASQAVTIATAATGGASGNHPGNAGGVCSLGALISASGGGGGNSGAAATLACHSGGAGGIGTGGDYQLGGCTGYPGFGVNNATIAVCYGGNGGNTFFGGGGTQAAQGAPGGNATSFGGGGGGGCGGSSASAVAGGNGAAGVVIVTEYIIN